MTDDAPIAREADDVTVDVTNAVAESAAAPRIAANWPALVVEGGPGHKFCQVSCRVLITI